MAQTIKSLPAVQETWVRSLGWEDPLEKEMATHSSALAWKIPWTEEPGGLQSMWLQSVSVAPAEFSKFAGILSAALSQRHLSGFGIAQLEFHHLR